MALIPDHLRSYQRFIVFMFKYWNSNLFDYTKEQVLGETDTHPFEYDRTPEELVDDLRQMGPAYIKMGQLLSTRPDLLPAPYLEALGSLQDDVGEMPFQQVQEIIESELGVPATQAFAKFEETPLASASIGQVHRAVLPSGREVVVKIQRPGLQQRFTDDLNTLKNMTDLAVKHTKLAKQYALDELLQEMRRIMFHELDYVREARNLLTLHENMREFSELVVPLPLLDYTAEKVLTMEYLPGKKITSVSPVKLLELDTTKLADQIVQAYIRQIVVDGFVHADPHPGNIHLTDNNKIALLDLGMAVGIPRQMREILLQLLFALSRGDGQKVAELMLKSGKLQEDHNTENFTRTISILVSDKQNASLKEMKLGLLIIRLNQAAAVNGITLPMEINLLAKVLLNLDQTIGILDARFDFQKSVQEHAQDIIRSKMWKDLAPENFWAVALETRHFLEKIPERLNRIMDLAAHNKLKVKVDALDEKRITDGFQKVANRITLGLILAAMIIGAAMLMNVKTKFTIFGYPGLAIILFLLAIVGGVVLSLFIIFKDENLK